MSGLIRYKNILASLFVLFSLSSHAFELANKNTYYPEDFYNQVSRGETGQPLKKTLFAILSSVHVFREGQHDELAKECPNGAGHRCYQHVSLGYNTARRILFGHIHLETDTDGRYAIRDVYCNHLSTEKDFGRQPPGPGLIPDPNIINAEHTWPQSRFSPKFNKDMQKSDLHILYPALSQANTSRSNNEFNEVVSTISSPCAPSKRGYSNRGQAQVYFEPPARHKGNVARALFYFAVRYSLPISQDEEESLKTWHRQDPVDEFEKSRHEIIFAKQKDRNPFIDHPELVDLIADF